MEESAMRCPFLREAQVKSCRASTFRKMIVRLPGQPDNERCSSSAYMECPAARQHHEEHPSLDHCPFLQESLVQYCAAGSVTKYVPYSESVLSRCGTDSHKYCELFVALANPGADAVNGAGVSADQSSDVKNEHDVDGMRVPDGLWYSPNHMWLDVSDDGVLHVGIDAFLARILGDVDQITFVTTKGTCRPTAVLSLKGADLQMMFPREIVVTKTNSYLRTNPSKMLADPYSAGWLFEGVEIRETREQHTAVTHGLISGKEAATWMHHELARVNTLVHDLIARPQEHGVVLMADGGGIQTGFMKHLDRVEILQLFNEFFSPLANWRKVL